MWNVWLVEDPKFLLPKENLILALLQIVNTITCNDCHMCCEVLVCDTFNSATNLGHAASKQTVTLMAFCSTWS